MSFVQNLTSPNIKILTNEEKMLLEKQVADLMEKQDISGLAKITQVYPMSAETLDSVKRGLGIEFLLKNNVNLVNAINEYGADWLNQ